jgi:hypothetical protein
LILTPLATEAELSPTTSQSVGHAKERGSPAHRGALQLPMPICSEFSDQLIR